MNFHIITLFPESFDSYINSGILGRAIKSKKIKVKFYNPRDYVKSSNSKKGDGSYRRVDDKPYGGGAGMVLQAEPILKSVENIKQKAKNAKVILLSPAGKNFNNAYADKLAQKVKDVIIICGRYEGIDARVTKIAKAEEISIGPYVLTGGELGAMIILDTVGRRLDGVLGNIESIEENRISSSEVYTRPEILEYKSKKYRVPKILLSGNHQKIEDWKKSKNHLN